MSEPTTNVSSPDESALQVDAHRLSEFVYGTITGMVAVAGLSGGKDISWWSAVSIVVMGAVAIWLAHAYSRLVTLRVTTQRRVAAHQIRETLTGSWPIVTAGALLSVPFFAAGGGLWSVETALLVSSLLGIAILGIVGSIAGRISREKPLQRLLIAAVYVGLGVFVVLVEFIVHH